MLWKVQLLLTAVLAVAAVTTMALTILFTIEEQRPYGRYSQPTYQPAQSMLCPGDLLEFRIEYQTFDAAVFGITWSWYSVDESRTIIPNDSVWWVVNVQSGSGYQRLARVIPDLSPGKYELQHASFTPGREEVLVYTVPFEVKVNCP
jgi:hypothetical protein